MKKIKIGVIVCGSMAQGQHLPNIARNPNISLAWCCDLNEKVLSQIQDKFHPEHITTDYHDLLEDTSLDVVLISTPHQFRLEPVKEAAQAGKHIYVEKPMAGTWEEVIKIKEIVKKTGIVFCVGHNRRQSPAIIDAKNIFLRQRTNPVCCNWRMDRNSSKRKRLQEEDQDMLLLRINDDILSWQPWAFEDGIMLSELTHFTDLACYLMEKRPKAVQAIGSAKANNIINIKFEDGSLASIFCCSVGTFGYPKELIELYTHGSIAVVDHYLELRVAGIEGERFKRIYPLVPKKGGSVQKVGVAKYYQIVEESLRKGTLPPLIDKGHYAFLDEFVNAVRGEGKSPCNVEEASLATLLIFKSMQSVREHGRAVPIRDEEIFS